jgi:hypothetical protein
MFTADQCAALVENGTRHRDGRELLQGWGVLMVQNAAGEGSLSGHCSMPQVR